MPEVKILNVEPETIVIARHPVSSYEKTATIQAKTKVEEAGMAR